MRAAAWFDARDEPPLRGSAFGLALAVFTVLGLLLGIVTAFLVPIGPRIGERPGPLDDGSGGSTQALGRAVHAAAGATGSYGTLLSLGVLLAFLGCLVLGALTRYVTGSRTAPLAPVSAWLVIALLALSSVRGDIVLPAEVTPGIAFLYAGVLGGAGTLLPAALLPRALRDRLQRPPSRR